MTRNHPQPSRRAVLGSAAAAALTVATGTGTGTANATGAAPAAARVADGLSPPQRPSARGDHHRRTAVRLHGLPRQRCRVPHRSTHRKGRVRPRRRAGTAAIGLKLDHDGLLHIAGGGAGTAKVVDARTGRLMATHQLTGTTGHFVNDVILVRDRAWFTDSRDSALYGVPRGCGGRIRRLPLTGEWVQTPDVNNANGIVATPDGRGLIVVSSTPGRLYHVDLRTGRATVIALNGAESVANGDGLLRIGRTLYVVQNRLNVISVFELDAAIRTATLRRTITDPRFDVPTTVARWADRLYLVNARFTSPQTPGTTFNGVAVPL